MEKSRKYQIKFHDDVLTLISTGENLSEKLEGSKFLKLRQINGGYIYFKNTNNIKEIQSFNNDSEVTHEII